MAATLDATTQTTGGYGLALLQAVVALAVVSALAWFVLRFLAQRGVGLSRGKLVQVEERLPLDMKNALLVVRVEQRRLLLATGDHGPARLITELGPAPDTKPHEAPP